MRRAYPKRAPWIVSFGFGSIHGLGFGSALSEVGLPQSEIVTVLLALDIGVELGQLALVLAALAFWAVLARMVPFSGAMWKDRVDPWDR